MSNKATRMFLSIMLAVAMVVTATFSIPSASYANANEPSAWAKKLVESAIKKGYVPNNLQGRYKSGITKLELSQLMLGYLEHLYGKFQFTENGEQHNLTRDTDWRYVAGLFEDTGDRAADILYTMKIMDAAGPEPFIQKYSTRMPSRYLVGELDSKGSFEPNFVLTRSYAGYFLYRFFETIGAFNYNDAILNYGVLKKFKDIGDDSGSYHILALHSLGLYGGSGNLLNLDAPLTREQAISILEKFDTSKYKQVINQYLGIGNARPFSFRYKKGEVEGVAHLYSDNLSNGLLMSIPGKKGLVFASNRDLTMDSEGQKNWSFEVYLNPQDVFADEQGNIHVVYFFFEGFDRYMPDETTPRAIVRKYSPDGAVLETKTLYVRDISGMKANEFFRSDSLTKVEYKDGSYFMAVVVGNLKDKKADFVPATLTIQGNKGTLKRIADAGFKSSHIQYAHSKKLGGYVYLMDSKYGENRGLNLLGPDGKRYTIMHDWHAPKAEMGEYYYSEDTRVGVVAMTATDRGLAIVGSAPREIAKMKKDVRKSDLYIQVITKLDKPNPSMFLGGVARVGTTNTPTEKKVTDYGVIWLTDVKNYETVNEVSVTPIEDKLLVTYTVDVYNRLPDEVVPKDAPNGNYQYYMVLATDGTVLKAATKMPKYTPYMYAPVYWNGKLYWSTNGGNNGGVRANELKLEMK